MFMAKAFEILKSEDLQTLSEAEIAAYISAFEAEIEKKDAVLKVLEAKNKKLEAERCELEAENEKYATERVELEAEKDQLKKKYEAEVRKLIEMIRISNARYFGAKSEKICPDQISLFNDMEAAADDSPEPSIEHVVSKKARKAKRKISVDLANSNLPRTIIEHTIAEGDLNCSQCAGALSEMNIETTYKLKKIPAHFEIEEHRRHVYICKTCSKENAEGADAKAEIVRAPIPVPPIENSFATPSLIASVIDDKYTRSLPLYRIEQDLTRSSEIQIGRNTMANWVIHVADRWFSKIYDCMKDHLLSASYLLADETKVQVLKEPKRKPKDKSYMWVFATGRDDIPITLFEYSESRAAAIPKAFLGGKTGFFLQCDGYQVYKTIDPGITVVACLAHARRKYTDIVKALPSVVADSSNAAVAVAKIDEMFSLDHSFDGLLPEERKKQRLEKLGPPLESYFVWVRAILPEATPDMSFAKALQYSLNQEPYIMNILLDGRLELSSNRVERCIRPFAIGRRNFLFSDTPKGAHASAILYSVVQTAIANDLKPFDYLNWVLEEMPQCDLKLNPEDIQRFLPWASTVPTHCCLKPSERTETEEPVLLPPDIDIEEIESAIESLEELLS